MAKADTVTVKIETDPPIERLAIASLRPGDYVIVTVPQVCDQDELDAMYTSLHRLFPDQVPVVLAGGATLEVRRPEDMAEAHLGERT